MNSAELRRRRKMRKKNIENGRIMRTLETLEYNDDYCNDDDRPILYFMSLFEIFFFFLLILSDLQILLITFYQKKHHVKAGN